MNRTNRAYKNTFEVIRDIETIFRAHPDVNNYLYGVYHLLECRDVVYPLVSLTVNHVTRISDNILQLSFNLVYADRLSEDRSNMAFIQSVGTSVVLECLNKAVDCGLMLTVQDNYAINPFTEQFADNCAGVAATVVIRFPSFIGQCEWVDIPACEQCTL